jgi:branched-chain amino acid transport system substrate-binding protein
MSARFVPRRVILVALSAMALAFALAACGSSSSSSSAGGTSSGSSSSSSSGGSGSAPIKIGAVSSITGPIPIPDGTNGATAYFDALNAKGGINGHKIQYIIDDDQANPATSAQDARQLVDSDNVVALVGGESLVECPINGRYYKSVGIYDVMGGAATPTCFTSPNISPTNVGLQDDITAGLYFATQTLHKTKVCAAMYNLGSLDASYQPAISLWQKVTGKKLAFYTQSLTENTDLGGIMLQAKQAGCQALISNGASQAAEPLLRAAAAQGATGITQIFMGQEYISSLPAAVGKLGNGIYSVAEFEPITGNSPAVTQMKADMIAAHVPVTALAQSGWLAAKVITSVIGGLQGPVTRASVGAALQKLTSFDTDGATEEPYAFGPGSSHHSNRSVKMVQIQNGKWKTVSGWINVGAMAAHP